MKSFSDVMILPNKTPQMSLDLRPDIGTRFCTQLTLLVSLCCLEFTFNSPVLLLLCQDVSHFQGNPLEHKAPFFLTPALQHKTHASSWQETPQDPTHQRPSTVTDAEKCLSLSPSPPLTIPALKTTHAFIYPSSAFVLASSSMFWA